MIVWLLLLVTLIIIGSAFYGLVKLFKFLHGLYTKRIYADGAKVDEMRATRAMVETLPRLQKFLETSSKGLMEYDRHRYQPSDAIMAFLKIEKGLEDLNPDLLKISKEERQVALKALEHFHI